MIMLIYNITEFIKTWNYLQTFQEQQAASKSE